LLDASGTTDAVDLKLEVEIGDSTGIETYETTVRVIEDLL
jgi:hypothetical protein